MAAPLNIQPNPGASDTGVASFDQAGNQTLNGSLVLKGGAVVLGKLATAPVPVPGAIQLYTTDGVTLSFVAAGGTAAGQTVSGNLTVTGSATVGAGETVTGILSVTSAQNTMGVLQVTNTVDNASDGTFHMEQFDATSRAIGIRVTGEAQQRYVQTTDGGMAWGAGGTSARDTFMSRSAPAVLTMPGTNTASVAAVLTPTFANGTAAQLSDTTRDYMVYFQIGTVGTAFSLAIGPTSGVANSILVSANPGADESISFRLPAGWFAKWSGTTTTLANQIAIGC